MPEVCLLIAMKRLEEQEFLQYNFQMAFAEYRRFITSMDGATTVHNYEKRVAFKAFEHLVDVEPIKFADTGSEMPLSDYRMVVMMIDADSLVDALKDGTVLCSTEITRWATSVSVA